MPKAPTTLLLILTAATTFAHSAALAFEKHRQGNDSF
jgi:hypothetical protein